MLCTRVAVLQRKENVQIQISHSRCKRKKKNCEDKITGCPLTKCCISSSYYVHKKNFVPKCNKPDRENGEIQEKDWREQLIWGSISLLSVHGLWRSERAWAATAKEETWVRSNNLVDIPCVISPLCKICCSILHVICAEHRWGGGKEKKRTEMGELWNLREHFQLLKDQMSCWIWPAGQVDDFMKTGTAKRRDTMDLMNGAAIHCSSISH